MKNFNYLLDKMVFFKLTFLIILMLMLMACDQKYKYMERTMPVPVDLSLRLKSLFDKTKIVCFGRYAIEVPLESRLIVGNVGFPYGVEAIDNSSDGMKLRIAADTRKIIMADSTAEIKYSGIGPIEGSWQIQYYEDEGHKGIGAVYFQTYVDMGGVTLIIEDAVDGEQDTALAAERRQAELAQRLRLRKPDEVPEVGGYCTSHAFVLDGKFSVQETANAGLYFPSLPDVTFSISSNKDAYGDYPTSEYEAMREELSLLNRIAQAKADQGTDYPSRTVLREGKRNVHHWKGEESLFKRDNGVHDFEWALVGTPGDISNPAVLGVVMFSKVAHNTVGAADSASVSDDEAVALWDKLLSGLKYRVKVPGAPEGAYFIDPAKPHGRQPAN